VLPIAAQIYVWLRKPKVLAGEKPIEADIPTTRYSELAGQLDFGRPFNPGL
jgi:hypothetical protein